MLKKATYVRPSGNLQSARLIIVGEQPGTKEVLAGQPFVGPAGMELDSCLIAAKIPRSECYFTNVIKDLDRALEYYISFTKNGPVISPDGQEYINLLGEELRNSKAEIILALGNVAMFALTNRLGIYKWRGSILDSTLVIAKKIIPTLHPATVIPPKNVYLNHHTIVFDCKRAWELVNHQLIPTRYKTLITPTFHESSAFLTRCFEEGKKNKYISYDIEISNMEVSCISFAYDTTSMSIPFIDAKGNYFNPDDEAKLWLQIAEILESNEIKKLGQNLTFDVHFLLRKYGIHARNLTDTMIAQKILMPEYPMGLDFITSIWTDLPYYKEDGKFWLKGVGSFERGWEYNALDSIACSIAGPKQMEALKHQGNYETFLRSCGIILPLVYMQERGIRINVREMTKAYDEAGIHIEKLRTQLNERAGCSLNANSPSQLINYFYKEKKLPTYRKKGSVTTDEKAMIRIARKGYPEADLVLQIRRAVKERSTYLDPSKIDKDGRLRCSYNPAGTKFSRISSSENIFGTGNNLQNQPHNILKFFLADPGYVIYEIDLSQAENRIVAYVGRIEQMIEAFETGKDVHSLTGALISGLSYDEVKKQDKLGINAPIGKGDKTWRFWGKKSNHSFNYDESYQTFSLQCEIPEAHGKRIYHGYHNAWPGVKNNYHLYVKTCISSNRMLTNLMGRKTIFMGNLGNPQDRDKLFKSAYSCIPQGTVGDIINERGLNYVYYNPHEFKPVELLMQVHDSIKFQIPVNLGWPEHARILGSIKEKLETPITTHYGRTFTIPADIKMGLNMLDMVKVKPETGSLETGYEKIRPLTDYRRMWE